MNFRVYLKKLWHLTMYRKWEALMIVLTSIMTTVCFLLLPVIVQNLLDTQVTTLTTKPWYETSNMNASFIQGKYYTQDVPQNADNIMHAEVAYEGDQAYFVENIPATEEITDIQNGHAYNLQAQPLDNKIEKLSNAEVSELYKENRLGIRPILIVYMIIAAMHPFFAWGNNAYVRKFSRGTIADMRARGFAKMQKLPMDYFAQRQDGKFISYLISDVGMFFSLASNIGAQLFQALLMFIGIYFMLARLDIRLFLGALLALPLIAAWIYVFRKKVVYYYEKARSSSSALNALLNEQFKGISVIRAFSYQEKAEAEFDKLNDAVYDYGEKQLKIRSFMTGSLVNVIRRTLWLLIIIYAGSLYFGSGKAGVSMGLVYLLVSYVNYYVEPLYQLFGILQTIEQANVSVQRYFRYMDEQEETEKPDAISTPVPRFKGRVKFENLNFGYTAENQVLYDVNFDVKPDTTVAIVGHTGSGKSSLMNLLMRFYDYKEGRIMVDEYEITDMTRNVYRDHVGIILQDPVLFKGTLYDAVTWGNHKYSQQEVADLLTNIGAGELLEHPDGLEQEVNEMGSNFSLGQRQLIAFARAIIQNPSILILDEATANIDTETERKIQEALAYASKGRTTFIIAHRLSTIKDADKIIVLDKGRIIEEGTHQELLKENGMYLQMYEAQAK